MSKLGRPKKEFSEKDWTQVKSLCGIMCTAAEICGIMDIDEDTLNRLIRETYNLTFSEFFNRFSAKGKISLRRRQMAMAEKNATMSIWLGKQYLGQADKAETEKSGIASALADALTRLEIARGINHQ